jgi:hypothetical protein
MGHTPAAIEAPVLGAQFASIGIAFILGFSHKCMHHFRPW